MPSPQTPRKEQYEVVASVPDGLTWKPAPWGGRAAGNLTTMFSLGNIYKLVRVRATGAVTYYKLKGTVDAKSPAESIDAEPVKAKQVRYRVGGYCWFIDTDKRWYCMQVVERKRDPDLIAVRPVTGWDAERVKEWPYGALLEFPVGSRPFSHLRPLKARQR